MKKGLSKKYVGAPPSVSGALLKKSLEQIENDYWGEPIYPSYVVTTCYTLRKVPLDELTPEHIRLAVGQKIGLPYLVPLAIDLLVEDPWLDVKFYEGDLLRQVLSLEHEYFNWNHHGAKLLIGICKRAIKRAADEEYPRCDVKILELAHKFLERYSPL